MTKKGAARRERHAALGPPSSSQAETQRWKSSSLKCRRAFFLTNDQWPTAPKTATMSTTSTNKQPRHLSDLLPNIQQNLPPPSTIPQNPSKTSVASASADKWPKVFLCCSIWVLHLSLVGDSLSPCKSKSFLGRNRFRLRAFAFWAFCPSPSFQHVTLKV